MDARETLAKSQEDEFWFVNQNFYDFENEQCPWDLWVVVGKRDNMYLVVPWTADEESKLTNNDSPEHFFLPYPVSVQYSWDSEWMKLKGISENHIGTLFALAGYSQWRSEEELNALMDYRMRKLLPGEAEKVRKQIASFLG
jgi:hypothetical protein